jgi:hypothetical protein
LFSSAWTGDEVKTEKDSVNDTLEYWVWRLDKIIKEPSVQKFTFICADRVGKEKETKF